MYIDYSTKFLVPGVRWPTQIRCFQAKCLAQEYSGGIGTSTTPVRRTSYVVLR